MKVQNLTLADLKAERRANRSRPAIDEGMSVELPMQGGSACATDNVLAPEKPSNDQGSCRVVEGNAGAARNGAKARRRSARRRVVDAEGRPRSQCAVLVDLGREHHLFHDAGGDPYAAVVAGQRTQVLRVDGSGYREALAHAYYFQSGRGANSGALTDAVATLTAMARHDGPCEPVYLRAAPTPDGIVIDLGDEVSNDTAIVTASGWTVAPAQVHLRRAGKASALPRPAAAGPADFARLWRYVNVEAHDRVLVAAWMLAALRPCGPYPVLLLVGEQGTGKSSTTRALKGLVDPSTAPLRPSPRDVRDLLVGASNAWVLALDNLSGASPELSDALCRISTGGSLSERRLFTNTEEVLIEVQRPMILNGIEDVATRPDLADRCLHLALPPLAGYTSEAELAQQFAEDAPRILGALLNGLVLALRDHAHTRLGARLRMVDFAQWAAAGLPALGFTADEFVRAYSANRDELHEIAIEASPVASALVTFMEGRREWTGSAASLLTTLAPESKGPNWPRSAKGLLAALRRHAPALRTVGIEVTAERTRHARTLTVTRADRVGKQAS